MPEIQPIEITPNTAREVRSLNQWADCDRVLLALRIADVGAGSISAQYDAIIQDAQERKQRALQPITDRRERMLTRLEEFVRSHRADLEGQSIKLVHGTVGFRKGQVKVLLPLGEEHTIDRLRSRGHEDCLRTTIEIIKPAALKLPGVEQRLCGVELEQGETFFHKLAKSPAISYPAVSDAEPEVEDA